MLQNVPECAGEVGNTRKTSRDDIKNAVRHHMITIKGELLDECAISAVLRKVADKWSFQLEAGKEDGYEHWQIYCRSIKKMRMTAFKKLLHNTLHYEKVVDFDAAFDYCQKTDTRVSGPYVYPTPIRTLELTNMYDWQREVVDMCSDSPDDRSIYWYWESEGCRGKTSLAKYLCVHNDALFVSGKKNDILYAAANKDTSVYLIGYSRDKEEYVSYDALECLKDGLYFCSKYESNMIVRNSPHVVVFANFPPDESKLSLDRWIIKNI